MCDSYHDSRVMRKPAFCICENKDADQLRNYRESDQRLCFRYILNPKFQASSNLLLLYNPVYVGPGRKPRRPVLSQRCSYLSRVIRRPFFRLSCEGEKKRFLVTRTHLRLLLSAHSVSLFGPIYSKALKNGTL